MEIARKIKELAELHLASQAHFIVDVTVSKHKPMKITVALDGDEGVSIDDCANLSRQLSDELEKENSIDEAYTLEVGTPGIDQPLKLKRQYKKNIGREVKVHLTDKSIVRGKLVSADEEKIGVQEPTENLPAGRHGKELKNSEIPFTEIEKTIVIVSFK
jgi:ribosome maturation factor RimP